MDIKKPLISADEIINHINDYNNFLLDDENNNDTSDQLIKNSPLGNKK